MRIFALLTTFVFMTSQNLFASQAGGGGVVVGIIDPNASTELMNELPLKSLGNIQNIEMLNASREAFKFLLDNKDSVLEIQRPKGIVRGVISKEKYDRALIIKTDDAADIVVFEEISEN